MIEDKLQLPMGTPLQLQQEGVENPIRYNVKLLGYYPGKGMIVTNTEHNGKTVLLTVDTKLVVRSVQGVTCQAFRVKVVQVSMKPYPHLHLSWPDDVEVTTVRDARRIETKQPSLVRNSRSPDGKFYEAMIVDLSASGAKIATRVPIGRIDEMVELKMQLEVAEQDESLNLVAVIKSSDFKASSKLPLHYYGLSFKGINRFQKLVLHGYVVESTLKVKI